ncbi:ABC transporter permease [Antarcticimicrobium luteum]|uniref:Spermidine/putrescine transport system permease protein PotC n=1 Tax=Antarcticimicrobium luteum TaxID=2547397 RepID=A0A4R5VFX4_9RHOB|nr:ABC transporter permease [Antarcticimicrobium luteum]TDK51394.1 ABC transporter permease [Antarcticimicrobium luteum]
MRRSGLRDMPGFAQIFGLCVFLLYTPLIVIAVYSFNASSSITIWSGFTLDWYKEVFTGIDSQKYRDAAVNSLLVAVIASALSTVMALAAAVGMLRAGSFRGRSISFGLIGLPLLVPEIVTAVASLIFFSFLGLSGSFLTVLIAHTVFCIPFAYLPISARMQDIPDLYETAATDLYATKWQAFRLILLPMLLPGIVSGYLLSFIVSLDDFLITNFVKGNGFETLPTVIFGAVRTGIRPNIMAMSSLLLLISIVLVLLSYLIGRQGREKFRI